MKIYFDFNDWWVGYYRGEHYHFICPLPTLVIRWKRTRAYECRICDYVSDEYGDLHHHDPGPRCVEGNPYKFHIQPCSPGCKYPSPNG